MTFNDVEDLIRLPDEHPRLKSELRLRLFEDEWAPFMKYVREVLASSLAAIEQLKLSIADHDKRLAELQVETSAIRTELREETAALSNNQADFRAEVDQRFDAADVRFSGIDEKLVNLTIQVDDLRRRSLERDFRDKVHAFVGTFLLGTRIVTPDQLPGLYEAYESGDLSEEDYRRVIATDAVVRGRRKGAQETSYVAVEVSATVDEKDVERAKRTADILRQLGLESEALVFGNKIRDEAQAIAERSSVLVHLQV